jgi:D-sedoheptulose 7-phosphate isomerase
MPQLAARDGQDFAASEIGKLQRGLDGLLSAEFTGQMTAVATAVVRALGAGHRIFFCGNGGSAADAQHLAAELVGRQNYDRAPAAGIALTVDTSVLTALGNDYGYEDVFARQVTALGQPGDMLFGLSTSGRSANVVAALAAGRRAGMTTVAFTGQDPRDMAAADHVLAVPAGQTAQVQELHLVAGHIVFALVERTLFPKSN